MGVLGAKGDDKREDTGDIDGVRTFVVMGFGIEQLGFTAGALDSEERESWR